MIRRIKDSKLDELGLLDPDEPTESAHLAHVKARMMTRSDQLRQALGSYDEDAAHGQVRDYVVETYGPIVDAARFALKVWEGDEQLVQRIAAAIRDTDYSHVSFPMHAARAVLAAITEEDQK